MNNVLSALKGLRLPKRFGFIFLLMATVLACGETRIAIEVDGSSTVFPVTEAVAEDFRKDNPKVQVNVGVSGTGGGFKRFSVGETRTGIRFDPVFLIKNCGSMVRIPIQEPLITLRKRSWARHR